MTSKGVCCLAQQVFNAEQYYATSQISLQVPKMVCLWDESFDD